MNIKKIAYLLGLCVAFQAAHVEAGYFPSLPALPALGDIVKKGWNLARSMPNPLNSKNASLLLSGAREILSKVGSEPVYDNEEHFPQDLVNNVVKSTAHLKEKIEYQLEDAKKATTFLAYAAQEKLDEPVHRVLDPTKLVVKAAGGAVVEHKELFGKAAAAGVYAYYSSQLPLAAHVLASAGGLKWIWDWLYKKKDLESAARTYVKATVAEVREVIVEPTVKEIKEQREVVKQDIEDFGKRLKSSANSFMWKALAAGAAAITIGYASQLAWRKLDRYLNKPRLDYKKVSASDALRSIQSGFGDVVFSKEAAERLDAIFESTSIAHKKIEAGESATYRHAFLYGPLGSGKELWARKLARTVGMDFIEIPFSSFTKYKDAETKEAVDNFFKDVAFSSPNGTVIFIDHAEELLSKKRNFDNTLTKLKEILKTPSDKGMVILCAHDEKNLLRSGLESVIPEIVAIKRPGLAQRVKILEVCRNQLFKSDVSEPCEKSAKEILNAEKIEGIAQQFDGFCAKDMCECLKNIKVTVCRPSSGGLVTAEIVDKAVKELIDNRKIQSA